MPALLPSVPAVDAMSSAASGPAPTTAAPAASPNSTHVARSDQSISLVITSTPMTRSLFPSAARLRAMSRPRTNPAHPLPPRSKAGMFSAPMRSWTKAAVSGVYTSGVSVARMISSTSVAAMPASARAFSAAAEAKSAVDSSSATKCLVLMPVRTVIHSSDVSTNCAQSSLVITFSGTYAPRPSKPIR